MFVVSKAAHHMFLDNPKELIELMGEDLHFMCSTLNEWDEREEVKEEEKVENLEELVEKVSSGEETKENSVERREEVEVVE